MNEIIRVTTKTIHTLNCDAIKHLHNLLSEHNDILSLNPEPISPRGVKDENLLESAVNRQLTSLGEVYKYDNIFSNCASLVYGIVCNHPFHNGNKRAALLGMMLHLYRNGYYIDPVLRHDDLYEFLKRIAAHELHLYALDKSYKGYLNSVRTVRKKRLTSEQEVKFIEYWIKRNSVAKENNSKPLRWSVLRRILAGFQIEVFEDNSNKKVVLKKRISKSFLFGEKYLEKTYPDNGLYCYPKTLKIIRRDFNLEKEDGVDDNSFMMSEETYLDEIITTYKKVIYKLSLT